MSILAVVGDGMAGAHGVAAKVFNSLGDAAISVRAIAQGASERNISVVVDGKVARQGAARRARRVLSVAEHAVDRLDRTRHRRPRAAGADRDANRAPARAESGSAGARHRQLQAHAAGGDARSISSTGRSGWPRRASRWIWRNSPTMCRRTTSRTPSSSIARRAPRWPISYRDWLTRGIHVVTPNKKANSGTLPVLPRPAGGGARGGHALSVRGHGGRRPAGHSDAARPARNRR